MAGIALTLGIGFTSELFITATVITWLLMLFYVIFSRRLWTFSTRWLYGSTASIFMFLLGCSLTILNNELSYKSHFSKIKGESIFVAEVIEPLAEKDHTFKTVLRIRCIDTDTGEVACTGKVLAYFRKDSSTVYPQFGQTIIFIGKPSTIEGPKNPGAFNYRRYMALSNIGYQVFLKKSQWSIPDVPVKMTLMSRAQQIREYFLGILRHNGLGGKEYAVAAALILGQEDNLDAETYREYAGAGVMHILNVSGLHVGIIYMVFNFLLGFLNRNRKSIIIKTLIIIALIWSYAMITGFSPSVARSAAMFTVVSIGVIVNRNTHIINSLAVSALLLLAYNPYYLLNIGFQLSYIAVAGIVFLYDWIYHRFNPPTWIGDKIWQILSVSLAAQIATVPLSLYYFHQFPNYFLLANLVAIPFSTLVICSGMLVLATSFIPAVSSLAGYVAVILLKVLNGSISWIENLPHAVASGIPFRMSEMLFLYIALILIIYAVGFRNKMSFILTIVCLLIFAGFRTAYTSFSHNQQKFIVFAAGRSSVIGFVDGTCAYVVSDSIFRNDIYKQNLLLGRSTTEMGIIKTVSLPQSKENDSIGQFSQYVAKAGDYYLFRNKLVARLSIIPENMHAANPLKVDYLVINGSVNGHLTDILQLYDPGVIILEENIPSRKSLKWIDEGKAAGIEVYDIRKQGAFVADIKG